MTYKVIIRSRESGEEEYIDGLSKASAEREALVHSKDPAKQVYISWTDSKNRSGYLNRDGCTADCPGEPW
ncbi:MAG: hypothetical protein RR514_07465 [Christensenella sp.]